MKRQPDEVYSVTGARSGRSDDVSHRMKNYLVAMGLRVVCFVGGVLVVMGALPIPRVVGWFLLAGAVVLPYVAVVAANATRPGRAGRGPAPVPPESAPRLERGEPPRP